MSSTQNGISARWPETPSKAARAERSGHSGGDGLPILDNFIGQTFIRGSFDAGKFMANLRTAAFSSAAHGTRRSATIPSHEAGLQKPPWPWIQAASANRSTW